MKEENAKASPDTPALTPAGDRVSIRTKIAYGLGCSVDMWGHWLYPNLAYPVFQVFSAYHPGWWERH